jgi:hypothetical protein
VLCLGSDAREYGVTTEPEYYAGQDVLMVGTRSSAAALETSVEDDFDGFTLLPSVLLRHAGEPAMELVLVIGHNLHRPRAEGARAVQHLHGG